MDHHSAYFPWCLLSDDAMVSGRRIPALPHTLSLFYHACFPEAREKNELWTVSGSDWTLCWCCRLHFCLIKGTVWIFYLL